MAQLHTLCWKTYIYGADLSHFLRCQILLNITNTLKPVIPDVLNIAPKYSVGSLFNSKLSYNQALKDTLQGNFTSKVRLILGQRFRTGREL